MGAFHQRYSLYSAIIMHMTFFSTLKKLKRRLDNRQRLIEITISKKSLLANLEAYAKAYPKLSFAPVLKSNAYGHGLLLVAGALDKTAVPFFCIDSLYEAQNLQQNGTKHKLLILGYTQSENILRARTKNISFAITDLNQLQKIVGQLKRPRTFHLKLDTGMRRQGLLPEQWQDSLTLLKKNPMIILEGLYSHLADADNSNSDFTMAQIKLWNQGAEFFKKYFPEIKYFHLANTAGTAFAENIFANTARLGIGLYGIDSGVQKKLELKPALTMKSIISSLRELKTGDSVGYNAIFKATGPSKIATVPVGYYEGLDRRLSEKGFFKIGNQFCPIVGRVSMNMTSVDVTDVADVKVGDEVEIISANPADKNSAENIAALCGTIPYEILARLPEHLKRTLI